VLCGIYPVYMPLSGALPKRVARALGLQSKLRNRFY